MSGFLNDLRFGLRQLIKRPGFAAAVILTLALGIGANTTVFSVLSGYLLKPLPYPHGAKLVQINTSLPKTENGLAHLSVPEYLAVKHNAPAFFAAAVYHKSFAYTRIIGSPTWIPAVVTTASLFDVLGVHPRIGKVFTPKNMERGRSRVAVISDHLWRTRFGRRLDIVGATFRMNGDAYRIVGVMPPGFSFPDKKTELWVPLTIGPKDKAPSKMFNMYLNFIGNLRPGATLEHLRRQLGSTVRADIARVTPAKTWQEVQDAGFSLFAQPYRQTLVGDKTVSLWLLQGAVLLLLLITCVNVANLLLSRILGRSHEMAMRSALGASRWVLARQLLVEGLCLVVPGGIAGVALGWLGLHFLAQSTFGTGGGPFDLAIDWRVGLFALGAVCLTLILVNLLPIRYLARVDLNSILQSGSRTPGGGRRSRRVRAVLVATELTLATALLASAGLLLHSFVNLEAVDTGFHKQNVLMASLGVPQKFLSTGAAQDNFFSALRRHAKALPGVQAATISNRTPLSGFTRTSGFNIRGHKQSAGAYQPSTQRQAIDEAYFHTFGISLLRGRNFDARDTRHGQPVIIVDRNFARQFFPNTSAIGHQISFDGNTWYTIIGVVAPVQYQYLSRVNKPLVYLNAHQNPDNAMTLVMHTTAPPASLTKPLHHLATSLNPNVAFVDMQTMQQRLSDALGNQRTTMSLVLAFGGIALALAIVGIYGVMSHMVGQRRSEFGVRLALGALPEDVLWLVIKDGLKLLGIGLVAGLVLAVILGFVLSSQLFGVAPFDALTLTGTVLVLSVITLIACYLPARRAAKLDPAIAIME